MDVSVQNREGTLLPADTANIIDNIPIGLLHAPTGIPDDCLSQIAEIEFTEAFASRHFSCNLKSRMLQHAVTSMKALEHVLGDLPTDKHRYYYLRWIAYHAMHDFICDLKYAIKKRKAQTSCPVTTPPQL